MQVSRDPNPGNTPRIPSPVGANAAAEIVDPLANPEWDALVASHPDATIFHSSAWAQTLVESYGFKPRYVLQRDDRRLIGLLPLMQLGSRWFKQRLISLPFTDSCPPLVSASPTAPITPFNGTEGDRSRSLNSAAVGNPLLSTALQLATASGSQSIELRDCSVWTRDIQPSVTFLGHTVPLLASEEDQLQRCSPAMRRGLRKAGRSPLTLKEGCHLADVQAYYSLHCETRQRHGLPPQPFAFFRNIQRFILQKGLGFVILAMDGDVPVAGAIYFNFGRHALYKFGASSDSHLELRPNNLVLWQGIRRCSELGFSTLDLGRTSLDNEGLRRFKLGLGGEERLIHYVRQDLRSGSIVLTPDRAQGWHNRVFRRIPKFISRILGTILYRFVA